MDDLKRAKVSRRVQRSQATKTWNKAQALMAEAMNETKIHNLQVTLETFDAKIEQLKKLDENISCKIETEKELETEIAEADDYLNELMDKRYRIQHFISSNLPSLTNALSSTQSPSHQVEHSISNGHSSATQANSNTHRLPKLALPIFTGNPLKWQTFWDSYKAAVHDNHSLCDIQKFNYLKAHLAEDAVRSIEGIPLTETNYTQAIKILEERFGQTHKITNAHMQALLDLPNPTESAVNLRMFYDRMENHVRSLEALGKTQDTYGDLLVPIIMSKLPIIMKHNIIRQHGATDLNLAQLRKAVLKEIQILEASEETNKLNYFSNPLYSVPSTSSLLANASQHKEHERGLNPRSKQLSSFPKPRPCVFCKGSHKPNDCKKVSDPAARKLIVSQANLCFNCLNNHRVSQCKSKNRCRQCHQKHHTSLCLDIKKPNEQHEPNAQKDIKDKDGNLQCSCTCTNNAPTPGTTNMVQQTPPHSTSTLASNLHTNLSDNKHLQRRALLKTAIATVESPEKTATAHILFDEGAQRSFITEALAKKLNLTADKTETLHLSVFGGDQTTVKKFDVATVSLRTDNGQTIPIRVVVIPVIAVPQKNHVTTAIHDLPYLKGLKLAHPVTNDEQFTITLLIGADHYWDIVEDKIIRGSGPTAAKSKIGYLLSGPIVTYSSTLELNATVLQAVVATERDEETLERFWNLESIGISPNEIEEENKEFVKSYQSSSIHLENGRYTAELPWKPDHPPLPTNEPVAKGRTRSMIRRLAQDPKKLKTYAQIIADQEQRGFIEKVPKTYKNRNKLHYLPHHAVLKDSATTPLRVVFDCSCQPNKDRPSLNDCLATGPPLLNDLTAILVRFRRYRYAVTADIEKAFLHIILDEKDRDATRFFWLSDPEDPESQFVTYRFKAVLFGASCSPFILNATIKKHLESIDTPIAEKMKTDIYVDNLASGSDNEDDTSTFLENARLIMSPVGFNLRSWNSNDAQIRASAEQQRLHDKDPEPKVLGLRWNTHTDKLKFQQQHVTSSDNTNGITKREVLREASKIYDPLGLLTPVTIRAKILMQELWKRNYSWDQPLSQELQRKWLTLSEDLKTATQTEVSRRYFPSTPTWSANNTLHVFVDASVKAYGAVAYVTNGSETSLVMAKSRVAPLKKLTLPQLELMAAVLGARLSSYLQPHLQVSTIYLWSDSQIVLHWLSSKKELKQFVHNRVTEILLTTKNASWNYCPTNENPADLLTRGIPADQLSTPTLWSHGPPWITTNENWPTWNPKSILLQSTTEKHLEASNASTDQPTTDQTDCHEPNHGVNEVINLHDFSTIQRLQRVTAWVLRFANNIKKKKKKRYGPLSVSELDSAQTLWIVNCQSITYPKELANLQAKTSSRLPLVRQLRLFLVKDVIRCGGRIHNAPLHESTKFPILLPQNQHLTQLIVRDAHERTLHSGVNSTLTYLRQRYWIPTGRQYVKKIIRRCVTCRKTIGKAYTIPDPPPLPANRTSDTHPFTVTGVDFTGEIYVKSTHGLSKVYICLFTCANTRAVHLEVVNDLTVPTFIEAFRRFSSRKSLPRIMISDNASTYQSAAEELLKLLKSPILETHLSKHTVQWKFIPKRAPWYGGFWERLIGLTKVALRKVLGRANIRLPELQTIVTEIEAILNDRSLTFISSNIDDEQPLTPSHLLYGRRITALPHPLTEEDEWSDPTYNEDSSLVQHLAKVRADLIHHFWNRWRREYLTSLREFHKATGKNEVAVKVGDVVQVHDETKRINWRLAIIESLITGKDGLVRAANIRTSTGCTNRPIAKLYPLEVRATTPPEKSTTVEESSEKNDQLSRKLPPRKTRAAAVAAKEKIKDWTSSLLRPPEDVAE